MRQQTRTWLESNGTDEGAKPGNRRLCFLLSVLLILIFAFLWQTNLTSPYISHYNEGVFLLASRLIAEGCPQYGPVSAAQPPLFLEILALAFRVFGDTAAVGRAVVVFFSTVSLAAMAWIAWRVVGPVAAPFAVLCMGMAVRFFTAAWVLNAEVPSLTFALLAMGFLVSPGRRTLWTGVAGVLFALSLLAKLLTAPMVLPLLFFLALEPDPERKGKWSFRLLGWASLRRILVFGLASVVVMMLFVLPYDKGRLYDEVFKLHTDARNVYFADRNVEQLKQDVFAQSGLLFLGAVGLSVLFWKRPRAALGLLLWLVAAGFFLLWHSPLFPQHLVLILPPVILAASSGLLLLSSLGSRRGWRLIPVAFVILSFLSYTPQGWTFFEQIPRNSGSLLHRLPPAYEREAIDWIERHTRPTDFIVTDGQMHTFLTRRWVHPLLADTSYVRITSGHLTAVRAIEASQGARMIIFWTYRLERMPQYVEWVKAHYRLLRKFKDPRGIRREIYLEKIG